MARLLRRLLRTRPTRHAWEHDMVQQPRIRLAGAVRKLMENADVPTWFRDELRAWVVALERTAAADSAPESRYSPTPRPDECTYHYVGAAVRLALSVAKEYQETRRVPVETCRDLMKMIVRIEQLAEQGFRWVPVVAAGSGRYCVTDGGSDVVG